MEPHVIAARPFEGRRLRSRQVDAERFAADIAELAMEDERWIIDADYGGTVSNSYRGPAETECVLAVASPFGIVVYWTARVPANKASFRGAAEACYPGSGDLFDKRLTSEERIQSARDLMRAEFKRLVPEMLVIAVAAQH